MKELFKGVGDFKDRITLDLDTKNKEEISFIVYDILKTKNLIGLKLKKSTNKGYHLIAYYSKIKATSTKNKIRKLYDDLLRIKYDKKEKPNNILFWKK